MSITYRSQKGSQLTSAEVDANFEYLAKQVGLSGLTTPGLYTLIGSELKLFAETWVWSVFGETVTNLADYIYNVPAVTAGNRRVDVVVGNSSGGLAVMSGPVGSVEIDPVIPINYVKLLRLVVSPEGVNVSVLMGNYISKASEVWSNFVLTGLGGLPTLVAINENQRFINITGNPSGTSSLGGYHNAGGSIPTSIFWSGMTVKVHNATASDQVIKHNYSSATIKFLFPQEEDYIIKPNETITFTYRGGALEFEGIYLTAENISFNDSTTQLGEAKVQGAIEKIVDKISVLDGVTNINLFAQYTESTVSGTAGINLIQPDLGLQILEVDDLQEDSSYSGELVLNIENNNTATAKVIELFGKEIYNNTNPSAEITAKITFTLNFFNQVGNDIDYKLSWEYLSSGEILFGELESTMNNTSNVDFELIVTGHSTDNFNLKKARLWRN